MRTLATLTAAALLAFGAAACGSDDDPTETGGASESSEAAEIPGGADPEAVQVIDDWSRTLSEGDLEGAADYFAVPSIAQNGTPPLDLDSRDDVIAFNETLPCGAALIEATEEDRFIVATFELSDRPGGGCGSGAGGEAKTAFVIEDGKIVEWWRRAADDPAVEPPAEGPVV